MKKLFSLFVVFLLLLSACGSPDKPLISGSWYSVTDEGMYNFTDGEITLSGVTVGQYEDNGDYVVISMMSNGNNLKLYLTQDNGIDVLSDVPNGIGRIYFCKGLENAKNYISEQKMPEFEQYINDNLIGIWESMDSSTKIGFWNGNFLGDRSFPIESAVVGFHDSSSTMYYYWINTEFSIINHVPSAQITYSASPNGSSPKVLTITMTDSTFVNNAMCFDDQLMQREN